MRLLIMSDLHLDYPGGWRLPAHLPQHDVVVLAGDIHQSTVDAVRWADASFDRPVVMVAGNHDYWGGQVDQRNFDGVVAAMGTRVHFLSRDSVVIDGVTFCGATLWTDYALHGNPLGSMRLADRDMNDHRRIRRNGGRFDAKDALDQHRADLDALILSMTDAMGPTVVVTHHAPHPQSLCWDGDDMNPAYASDLTSVIDTCRPDLWIHGHVHASRDYVVGGTRIVCNPKGYGGGSAPGWRRPENDGFCMKVVEVVTGKSS